MGSMGPLGAIDNVPKVALLELLYLHFGWGYMGYGEVS